MISVIIPCYNASRTLKKSVRSVQRQKLEDLEIILVNDCSQDHTLEKCKKLAEKDPRIKIVDLPQNGGVDRARFEGIKASKGDYLMFLDSDDWLVGSHTLSEMMETLLKHDADYVEVMTKRILDNLGLIYSKEPRDGTKIIERPHLMDDYYLAFFGANLISVTMWGKLYKRSSINKAQLQPSGLKIGEDLHFNMMLFPHLQRIVLLDRVGHHYRFGGVTTKYNPYLFDNMLKLYQIKKGMIERYGYHKATDFIIVELINSLQAEICQCIRFSKDAETTKKEIADILNLEVWNDVENITEHPYWHTRPFTIAIKNKDASAAYDICEEIERKNRIPFMLKRLISKFFSII